VRITSTRKINHTRLIFGSCGGMSRAYTPDKPLTFEHFQDVKMGISVEINDDYSFYWRGIHCTVIASAWNNEDLNEELSQLLGD